jgi:hypothetical protein
VNAQTLSIALKESGLLTAEQQQDFARIRLPKISKTDAELPDDLPPLSRERKLTLLRMGLSSRYVHLCFEAYDRGIISSGRLSEVLLVDERDLASIAELFGARLNDGH